MFTGGAGRPASRTALEDAMDDAPPTHHEKTANLRAKTLLGSAVRVERRSIQTRAGGRTGVLVWGYSVLRGGGEDGEEEILGVSPPAGSALDLSRLGTPEEALQDALRRRKEGLGPVLPEETGPGGLVRDRGAAAPRPHWKPNTEDTTSDVSLDLPVA